MENSQKTYTVGTWHVKPGKEEEFIKHWTEFASWVSEKVNDTGSGRLLQDTEDPTKFISVGTWQDDQKVQEMRSTDEFKTFSSKTQDFVTEYSLPKIMKLASKVGK
ncbi:MAG: putative quinol monooxygenase [Bacteroidia bacterium]